MTGGVSLKNYETKASIVRALDELMYEKPYKDVTIADICERAPVAKSTFYRNFEDKLDAVAWYTHYLLSETVFKLGHTLAWKDAYLLFFRELKRSEHFFLAVSKSRGYLSIRRANRRTATAYFASRVEEKGASSDSLLSFQAHYFASSMIDVICDWIDDGMVDSPEIMTERLMSLLPEDLERALNLQEEPSEKRQSII